MPTTDDNLKNERSLLYPFILLQPFKSPNDLLFGRAENLLRKFLLIESENFGHTFSVACLPFNKKKYIFFNWI